VGVVREGEQAVHVRRLSIGQSSGLQGNNCHLSSCVEMAALTCSVPTGRQEQHAITTANKSRPFTTFLHPLSYINKHPQHHNSIKPDHHRSSNRTVSKQIPHLSGTAPI